MDSDCIMTGDLGHVKLTSDESTALRHTSSVYNIAQKQSESTFVQKAHDQLKHLIEEVTKELDTVYRAEYKEVVINNRMLTDWKTVALQPKTLRAAVVCAIQNKELVEESGNWTEF